MNHSPVKGAKGGFYLLSGWYLDLSTNIDTDIHAQMRPCGHDNKRTLHYMYSPPPPRT